MSYALPSRLLRSQLTSLGSFTAKHAADLSCARTFLLPSDLRAFTVAASSRSTAASTPRTSCIPSKSPHPTLSCSSFHTSLMLRGRRNTKTKPKFKTAPAKDQSYWPPKDPESWREYDPATGMPLPDGRLSHDQLQSIFQVPNMSQRKGNYILRVLMQRRMSGSLAELGVHFPELEDGGEGNGREVYMRGLEYLRESYPWDEEAAAVRWAEEEVKRIESEVLQERSVNLGLYKRTEAEEEYEPEPEPESKSKQPVYGESVLEARQREAKREAEEAEKKRKEDEENPQGGPAGPLTRSQDNAQQTGLSRWERARKNAEVTGASARMKESIAEWEKTHHKIKEPPKMTPFERLWPSALVTLLTIGGCIVFVNYYEPPFRESRWLPDTPPAAATCWTLVGLNFAVFALWRVRPLWSFMNKWFSQIPATPYGPSVFLKNFSHQDLWHLSTNMASLMLFGPALHDIVGRASFLALYLTSGTFGSFVSLSHAVWRKNWGTWITGASGATCGVIVAWCLLSERTGFEFPSPFSDGTVNLPFYPKALLVWVLANELIVMRKNKGMKWLTGGAGLDHWCHLAGYGTGAGFAAWVLWRRKVEADRLGIKRGGSGENAEAGDEKQMTAN